MYEESSIVLTSFTVERTGVDNVCISILSTLGNVWASVRRKAGMTVVVPPLARIQTCKNPLVPLQFRQLNSIVHYAVESIFHILELPPNPERRQL